MAEVPAAGLDVFYPIVPDASWVERLAPLGVRTLQLRVKDVGAADAARQVRDSLKVARRYGCQLIVNDYWREAIEAGADYIHLGQEDLAGADLAAIRAAGIRLGVSTHSEAELDTALAARPDYVALGPIYETKLKAMAWAPQGLARVGAWKRRVGKLPLVAIGGITLERADGVIGAGADSVAVVTDFVTAQSPEQRVEMWLVWAGVARVRMAS